MERNPVALTDSIDAMDLLDRCHKVLRKHEDADRAFLAEIKEQWFRHGWALRNSLGEESSDSSEEKPLTVKKPNIKLPRRKK